MRVFREEIGLKMNPRQIFLALILFSVILFISARYYNFLFGYVAALHLGLFSLAMYFLYDSDMKGFLAKMGVPGDLKTNVLYAVIGFLALLGVLIVMSLVFTMLGFNDEAKVADVANGLPLSVLAIAVLVAPISEELFFRGFLSTRIGIIPSALIFGLLHVAYGSVVEITGAFLIGIVFALTFQKSKSIIPVIVIHLVYNLISLSVIRGFA
jgi:membrane protease YdiL (CAAX protease family)